MTAVVTGASSGIGHAAVRFLLEQGYRVYGLGRSADTVFGDESGYSPLICDLARTDTLAGALEAIRSEEITLLVNAAGFGRFEPHETLSPDLIAEMTSVNLTAPMVLTSLLLRALKATGGTVINITSVEALRASKFSALYSATKAGLRAFGQSLFEEVRKSGVNVVTLNPDMTDTPFFDTLRFAPGESEDTRLLADDIVQAIALVLSMRPGAAVTELTVRPQRFAITKKQP
jgi:uncharacterized protein